MGRIVADQLQAVVGVAGDDFYRGAIVDGQTWNAAMRGGLEPDRSILKCDSGTVMRQLGVEIPQTATHTNLTDLHILVIHD